MAGDGTGRDRHHMLAEDDAGCAEAGVQVVVDHGLGTLAQLLSGLEHGQDRPRPLVACPGEERHGAQQTRGVHVMPAGVHDALVRRGVGQSGPLGHGQRVEVGAQQHGRALTVHQPGHHTGPPHALGDLVTQFPGTACDFRARAVFFEGKFGVSVRVLVQRLDILDQGGVQSCQNPLSRGGCSHREIPCPSCLAG